MINKKIIALTKICTLFDSHTYTGEYMIQTLTLNQLWTIIKELTHNEKDRGDLIEITYNKWIEKPFIQTKDKKYISDLLSLAKIQMPEEDFDEYLILVNSISSLLSYQAMYNECHECNDTNLLEKIINYWQITPNTLTAN